MVGVCRQQVLRKDHTHSQNATGLQSTVSGPFLWVCNRESVSTAQV
jgi:6-phosphogluconolactonase (cycloisomerase 2 family)